MEPGAKGIEGIWMDRSFSYVAIDHSLTPLKAIKKQSWEFYLLVAKAHKHMYFRSLTKFFAL